MFKSLDETRASLIIFSELVSAQQMAEIMQTKPSKIVVKDMPTGQSNIPKHPLHMAIFPSGLTVEETLERHVETILDMCEPVREPLLKLSGDCRITVHCTYLVHKEGGWTISKELCQRMASLPLEFVFSVEGKKGKRLVVNKKEIKKKGPRFRKRKF